VKSGWFELDKLDSGAKKNAGSWPAFRNSHLSKITPSAGRMKMSGMKDQMMQDEFDHAMNIRRPVKNVKSDCSALLQQSRHLFL
jgi:hypothetical protein